MLNQTPIAAVPYTSAPIADYVTNGCSSCGSITGPFVSGSAHGTNAPLHLCKTCVGVAADTLGWTAPDVRAELDQLVEATHAKVLQLGAELEQAKAEMSVPLAEVIDFVEERAKRRPTAPKPAKAGA